MLRLLKGYYVSFLRRPSGYNALLPEHVTKRIFFFFWDKKRNKKKEQKKEKSTSENEPEAAPNGSGQVVDAEEARRASAAKETGVLGETEGLRILQTA